MMEFQECVATFGRMLYGLAMGSLGEPVLHCIIRYISVTPTADSLCFRWSKCNMSDVRADCPTQAKYDPAELTTCLQIGRRWWNADRQAKILWQRSKSRLYAIDHILQKINWRNIRLQFDIGSQNLPGRAGFGPSLGSWNRNVISHWIFGTESGLNRVHIRESGLGSRYRVWDRPIRYTPIWLICCSEERFNSNCVISGCVSVFGYLTFLRGIWNNKSLQQRSMILMSLCVSDMCVIFGHMFGTVIATFCNEWPWGELGCQVWENYLLLEQGEVVAKSVHGFCVTIKTKSQPSVRQPTVDMFKLQINAFSGMAFSFVSIGNVALLAYDTYLKETGNSQRK